MTNKQNINTLDYWNCRFGTGDWKDKGGFSQTRLFAECQIEYLGIHKEFSGVLCDFGCGAGDAFPVYRAAFPNAKLVGVDFSSEAIQLCREKYSDLAEFIVGDCKAVPNCDVIIVSNVLEHLDDDNIVISNLLERSRNLFVIVPFQETQLCAEHVRSYSYDAMSEFPVVKKIVFASRGWSEFGFISLFINIRVTNIFRKLFGRPVRSRRMQILFEMAADL